MKHILLTGGTGFLGSHLARAFINYNHHVTILKRSTSDLWRIGDIKDSCTFHNLDDMPLDDIFSQTSFDAVFHTACCYGRNGETDEQITDVNFGFSTDVFDSAVKAGVTTFLNAGTLLARDANIYAKSKHKFVHYLEENSHKIQSINLRIEHMYGPQDDDTKFIYWLLTNFKNQTPRIALTKGTQKRDFVYITDVVSAFLCLLDASDELPAFSEFNVGSGVLTSIRDFTILLKSLYEKEQSQCKTELGFGDKISRDGDGLAVALDVSALSRLGWEAKTSLYDGLSQIIRDL